MHDLILHNANVLTLATEKPRPQVVAIKEGRISWVGREEELPLLKGPGTRTLDCQGHTVLPGFIDAHCHVLAYASSLISVDCGPSHVKSIGDIVELLAGAARQTPPGEWIRATGYNEFHLKEKRHPNRWDLDKAVPSHPVRLTHQSGHALVLNSQGLSRVGITPVSPDPINGVVEREEGTGEPTGILLEMSDYVGRKIPLLTEEQLRRGVKLASDRFLSAGVTSLQDASPSNSIAEWHTFKTLKEADLITPRVTLMAGAIHLKEFSEAGLNPSSGGDDLSLGAAKIMVTLTTGTLDPMEEQLECLMLQAHQLGFQIAVHAVEAEAVEATSRAYGRLLRQSPRRDHRHRIEHCSECPPHALKDLEGLGLVVVTQPGFLFYNGDRYLSTVDQEMQSRLYRFRAFMKAGLRPAAGSDAPVVEPDPLRAVYSAITRRSREGNVLSQDEAVSPQEALQMHTLAGAYAAFQEKEKGTIEPGKLGDLVIMDRDPTRADPEELREAKVIATIIGGKVAWEG